MQELAFELERHMVDYEKGLKLLPEEVRKEVEEATADRIPTGVAVHPEHGLAVLQTAGQGPCIMWMENENALPK